jgi:hypothetical protein
VAENKDRPAREIHLLNEAEGFEHADKTDPELIQKQVDEDFAARQESYRGRHRKDEDETTAGFAVLTGAA